ncbi:MAG: transposase [Chloroflexota bacterium]
MRTYKGLYRGKPEIYKCELSECPECGQELEGMRYLNGLKTVQTMVEVETIAYQPKRCVNENCKSKGVSWPSEGWQQIAPKYSTYGYDVVAQIGWERQKGRAQFGMIHSQLRGRMQISESQVRYLYHQGYLPLIACHERQHQSELEELGRRNGLLLGLDGLMPEGGEPQLWVIRELQTGWTLRSGWMSCQDEAAFIAFLQPIAELGLPVKAIMSDKQRGLLPAVAMVFPNAKHSYCQLHYLDNVAEPVAEADEQMKIQLRQEVRTEVGDLIRQKQVEKPVALMVTGMIPTPMVMSSPPAGCDPQVVTDQEREAIVQDILHRVRYLLTLKGRPPFRLAGIEMFSRLQEVADCVQELLLHHSEPRLLALHTGLQQSLKVVQPTYTQLCQAAHWLTDLAEVLNPDNKLARSAEQVRTEWEAYLSHIQTAAQTSPYLNDFAKKIRKVSDSYAPGLFYTYDIPGLPRTNNGREGEFRDLRRRLLSTTGQVGAVKRLLLREGAWELIPGPDSLPETIFALAHIERDEFLQERQRVQIHRAPFRLHTRSVKQSETHLRKLTQRWKTLPSTSDP